MNVPTATQSVAFVDVENPLANVYGDRWPAGCTPPEPGDLWDFGLPPEGNSMFGTWRVLSCERPDVGHLRVNIIQASRYDAAKRPA